MYTHYQVELINCENDRVEHRFTAPIDTPLRDVTDWSARLCRPYHDPMFVVIHRVDRDGNQHYLHSIEF